MKRLFTGLALGALGLAMTATPAAAQAAAGEYTITVLGGQTLYDESSALKNAPYGGIQAQYNITDNFGVGAYGLGARPTTDGTFYPLVRMEFNDTVFHYLVSQQMVGLDYGVLAFGRLPMGRLDVEVLGGVGRYTFSVDDQRNDRPTVPGTLEDEFSGTQFQIGGGIGFAVAGNKGIRLEVRDFIYTGYDREWFNLSDPLLGATNVPHPRPNPPEAKSTIHNIRVQLGFSFVPGGGQ